MRAVITAGGTAGHINPAIAIADEIMKNEPDSEILFVGRKDGMERRLTADAGYRIAELDVHGLMRRVTPKNIVFNIKSVICAYEAQKEAKKLFEEFAPDVVIGCGGYISGPVVRAAAKMGIRTAVQEQNTFPGITTRLLARYASVILCADEEGMRRIGFTEKSVVTGNPVRQEFFTAKRDTLRRRWNVGERVFVLSYGGSNGAAGINRVAAAFMKRHQKSGGVFHLHITGEYTKDSFSAVMDELGIDRDQSNIRVMEYADNMPECYAACDLIVARAGALTIAEIKAAGRASVLIPSPNVAENHQFHNAMSLANAKAALVYQEPGMDAEEVADKLMELVKSPDVLKKMGENAKEGSAPKAAEHIYSHIRALTDGD